MPGRRAWLLSLLGWTVLSAGLAQADQEWVVYEGKEGPGKGKHIVLVSGDDEYRSEETLPQLGKMLATHHGFKCTVLFPVDPATGEIKPDYQKNIPGLEALDTADLMILCTRFRNLPDAQMKHFVDYVESGKPIVALRTSTHAFNLDGQSSYQDYSWNKPDGGFGRRVLGETWVAHHGVHGKESTRGIAAPGEENHPIVRGIKAGEIWGPTDVYTVKLPLPGDSKPIVLGQVLVGMKADDAPLEGAKNDPMMPVAWTKSYTGKSGKASRIFTTTMGAATDFENTGVRRMLVNATYWALGMEDQITDRLNIDLVGEFKPTKFGFGGFVKGVKPADHR
ncbi:ThuA domain-containing protein [Planctomyces sp. SH-PL14]|uniref:ThuA domain-containing protein n=1 Tax=Planctomyces sp. SH-PL14 TaxID=1632864 RepID=UPI00078B897A|nr:ThuA domain-containing protein [Planctomyces sp. SH-PL14]AMV19487.1 Trehalose utilization [Planctomyces sp. SH-PL14]